MYRGALTKKNVSDFWGKRPAPPLILPLLPTLRSLSVFQGYDVHLRRFQLVFPLSWKPVLIHLALRLT